MICVAFMDYPYNAIDASIKITGICFMNYFNNKSSFLACLYYLYCIYITWFIPILNSDIHLNYPTLHVSQLFDCFDLVLLTLVHVKVRCTWKCWRNMRFFPNYYEFTVLLPYVKMWTKIPQWNVSCIF